MKTHFLKKKKSWIKTNFDRDT